MAAYCDPPEISEPIAAQIPAQRPSETSVIRTSEAPRGRAREGFGSACPEKEG